VIACSHDEPFVVFVLADALVILGEFLDASITWDLTKILRECFKIHYNTLQLN